MFSTPSTFRAPSAQARTARRLLGLVAAAVLLGALTPAEAQWRWRDKSGQVNASDRPPPRDIPDKDIISRPAPDGRRSAPPPPAAAASGVSPAASAAPSALEREVQARKRAAEQEQAAKAKAEEQRLSAQRQENCRNARSQQMALESGQRIARTNEKGEREVLDDQARAAELRRAREAIASECR
jgi:hypothetical protein